MTNKPITTSVIHVLPQIADNPPTFESPDGKWRFTIGFDYTTEEHHSAPHFNGDPVYHRIRDRISALQVCAQKVGE